MVKKLDRNLPTPPTMAQPIITDGLSILKPATIIDAAARLSPKILILLGVGEK
jgi:hypothetical protein